MNTQEPTGKIPAPTKETHSGTGGFSAHEQAFFDEKAAMTDIAQAAATDVAGRPLTPDELFAITAEIKKRVEAEKSDIRKFFERHGKTIARALAVILGFSTISIDAKTTHPSGPDDQITVTTQNEIIKTSAELWAEKELGDDFLQLIELNLVAYEGTPEYVGRSGRPEWAPLERLRYSKLPTEAKLYSLHPEFAHYSDMEFLENFDLVMESARTEFKHTDLREQLATGAIERVARLAPSLEVTQLINVYDNLLPALEHEMGLQYTISLRTELDQVLPADHPLKSIIAQSHLTEDRQLLDKSIKTTNDGKRIKRSIVFDQERGVVDVKAQAGDQTYLLSSYPGNGGDPRFSSTGKTTKELAATRGGEYRVRTLETGHVSPNWTNSLIPQDAAIKQVGEDIMYQTADGKFHYATGPKAEFIGCTPFDGQITAADRALLISAGQPVKIDKTDTERIQFIKEQGGWLVQVGAEKVTYVMPMTSFSVDDFKDKDGKIVTHWKKNDFGPKTLIYETLDGQRSQQLFHSNYLELKGQTFLDTSHGCIHMYQEHVGDIFTTVNPGDSIVITSIKPKLSFPVDKISVNLKPPETVASEG